MANFSEIRNKSEYITDIFESNILQTFVILYKCLRDLQFSINLVPKIYSYCKKYFFQKYFKVYIRDSIFLLALRYFTIDKF